MEKTLNETQIASLRESALLIASRSRGVGGAEKTIDEVIVDAEKVYNFIINKKEN